MTADFVLGFLIGWASALVFAGILILLLARRAPVMPDEYDAAPLGSETGPGGPTQKTQNTRAARPARWPDPTRPT
jgi:hypothetical protein